MAQRKRAPRKDAEKDAKTTASKAEDVTPDEKEVMDEAQSREEQLTAEAAEVLKKASSVLDEAEESNALASEILNLPDEFEVSGKKIRVYHKTPRQLIALNKVIIESHKIRVRLVDANSVADHFERLDLLAEIYEDLMHVGVRVLFHIINEDPLGDKPEFTEDWIMDNLHVTDEGEHDKRMGAGVGIKIRHAYDARLEATNFFTGIFSMQVM